MANAEFRTRVHAIDWLEFHTAYGIATTVPQQLIRVAGSSHADAMKASHELWCGLCHQHAYVSTAALPACPFLLEVFDSAGRELRIELLDIFRGFAVCTRPEHDPADWAMALRKLMAERIPMFQSLCSDDDEEISGFSEDIVEWLADPVA